MTVVLTRPEPQIGSLHGLPISAWVDCFWPKVNIDPDGCWLWTACDNGDGYGRLAKWRSPTVLAHRLSWMIHNGPIPEGMKVLHRCDVRRCVRPDHLFLGTTADNQNDAAAKRRLRHKITPELAQRMVDLYSTGMTIKAVAAEVGVSYRHSRLVLTGKHRYSTGTEAA